MDFVNPFEKKVWTYSGIVTYVNLVKWNLHKQFENQGIGSGLGGFKEQKTFKWTRKKGLPMVSWKQIRFSKKIEFELRFTLKNSGTW